MRAGAEQAGHSEQKDGAEVCGFQRALETELPGRPGSGEQVGEDVPGFTPAPVVEGRGGQFSTVFRHRIAEVLQNVDQLGGVPEGPVRFRTVRDDSGRSAIVLRGMILREKDLIDIEVLIFSI